MLRSPVSSTARAAPSRPCPEGPPLWRRSLAYVDISSPLYPRSRGEEEPSGGSVELDVDSSTHHPRLGSPFYPLTSAGWQSAGLPPIITQLIFFTRIPWTTDPPPPLEPRKNLRLTRLGGARLTPRLGCFLHMRPLMLVFFLCSSYFRFPVADIKILTTREHWPGSSSDRGSSHPNTLIRCSFSSEVPDMLCRSGRNPVP